MTIEININTRIQLRQLLPYALCNIKNEGKFCFVNRDYCVLGAPRINKNHIDFKIGNRTWLDDILHINKIDSNLGFCISPSKMEKITLLISPTTCFPGYQNFYFFDDHNSPFYETSTKNDVQNYFDLLGKVLDVLSK